MGDLPSYRVKPTDRPFVHTGVDYAGPLLVRSNPGRGYKSHKAYIAVFVCMTVKAVHLELVSDYTSDAFLAAYHRFVSRRGQPSDLYSDNGTTFVGADRELTEFFQAATRAQGLTRHTATKGISWHFIPPAAPHFGGLWEAAVKSVKVHLRRCVGVHRLIFEEMTNLLCRIEACLNSRPLTAVTDNLDDYNYLTPGHFLIGTVIVSPPEPSVLSLAENRLSRWQLIRQMTESFWHAWQHDYLHALQQRPKRLINTQLFKVGQMVLVKDSRLPQSHWSLGRITHCHPGPDDLVRIVTVKTKGSELKRPINKLCLLPVAINQAERETSALAGGGREHEDL